MRYIHDASSDCTSCRYMCLAYTTAHHHVVEHTFCVSVAIKMDEKRWKYIKYTKLKLVVVLEVTRHLCHRFKM